MAVQADKKCSVCYRKGHNATTCSTKGAIALRKLQAKVKNASVKPRPVRRKLRPPLTFGRLAAKRSLKYRGVKELPRATEPRKTSPPTTDEKSALADLVKLGFVKVPKKCLGCKCPLKDASQMHHGRNTLAWRCSKHGCRHQHTPVSCSPFGVLNLKCSCVTLLRLLKLWATERRPPTGRALARLGHVSRTMAIKLANFMIKKEAAAAEAELQSAVLKGQVEMDGALLYSVRVGANNPNYQTEIEQVKTRLRAKGYFKKNKVPASYKAHVRMLGFMERASGRVLVSPMPLRFVPPGSPPSPESASEALAPGVLQRLDKRSSIVFSDAAHGFKKAIKTINKSRGPKLLHFTVNHSKGEYTRDVRARGKSLIAGTQAIDAKWRLVKQVIVAGTRGRVGRKVSGAMMQKAQAMAWRLNRFAAADRAHGNFLEYLSKAVAVRAD
jgi:hypothetical protein